MFVQMESNPKWYWSFNNSHSTCWTWGFGLFRCQSRLCRIVSISSTTYKTKISCFWAYSWRYINICQKFIINLMWFTSLGYGVTSDGAVIYVNASTCDINYIPKNLPIIFDIPLKKDYKKWTMKISFKEKTSLAW